jgi:hypothetical protein
MAQSEFYKTLELNINNFNKLLGIHDACSRQSNCPTADDYSRVYARGNSWFPSFTRDNQWLTGNNRDTAKLLVGNVNSELMYRSLSNDQLQMIKRMREQQIQSFMGGNDAFVISAKDLQGLKSDDLSNKVVNELLFRPMVIDESTESDYNRLLSIYDKNKVDPLASKDVKYSSFSMVTRDEQEFLKKMEDKLGANSQGILTSKSQFIAHVLKSRGRDNALSRSIIYTSAQKNRNDTPKNSGGGGSKSSDFGHAKDNSGQPKNKTTTESSGNKSNGNGNKQSGKKSLFDTLTDQQRYHITRLRYKVRETAATTMQQKDEDSFLDIIKQGLKQNFNLPPEDCKYTNVISFISEHENLGFLTNFSREQLSELIFTPTHIENTCDYDRLIELTKRTFPNQLTILTDLIEPSQTEDFFTRMINSNKFTEDEKKFFAEMKTRFYFTADERGAIDPSFRQNFYFYVRKMQGSGGVFSDRLTFDDTCRPISDHHSPLAKDLTIVQKSALDNFRHHILLLARTNPENAGKIFNNIKSTFETKDVPTMLKEMGVESTRFFNNPDLSFLSKCSESQLMELIIPPYDTTRNEKYQQVINIMRKYDSNMDDQTFANNMSQRWRSGTLFNRLLDIEHASPEDLRIVQEFTKVDSTIEAFNFDRYIQASLLGVENVFTAGIVDDGTADSCTSGRDYYSTLDSNGKIHVHLCSADGESPKGNDKGNKQSGDDPKPPPKTETPKDTSGGSGQSSTGNTTQDLTVEQRTAILGLRSKMRKDIDDFSISKSLIDLMKNNLSRELHGIPENRLIELVVPEYDRSQNGNFQKIVSIFTKHVASSDPTEIARGMISTQQIETLKNDPKITADEKQLLEQHKKRMQSENDERQNFIRYIRATVIGQDDPFTVGIVGDDQAADSCATGSNFSYTVNNGKVKVHMCGGPERDGKGNGDGNKQSGGNGNTSGGNKDKDADGNNKGNGDQNKQSGGNSGSGGSGQSSTGSALDKLTPAQRKDIDGLKLDITSITDTTASSSSMFEKIKNTLPESLRGLSDGALAEALIPPYDQSKNEEYQKLVNIVRLHFSDHTETQFQNGVSRLLNYGNFDEIINSPKITAEQKALLEQHNTKLTNPKNDRLNFNRYIRATVFQQKDPFTKGVVDDGQTADSCTSKDGYYYTKEGNYVHVRACGTEPPKTDSGNGNDGGNKQNDAKSNPPPKTDGDQNKQSDGNSGSGSEQSSTTGNLSTPQIELLERHRNLFTENHRIFNTQKTLLSQMKEAVSSGSLGVIPEPLFIEKIVPPYNREDNKEFQKVIEIAKKCQSGEGGLNDIVFKLQTSTGVADVIEKNNQLSIEDQTELLAFGVRMQSNVDSFAFNRYVRATILEQRDPFTEGIIDDGRTADSCSSENGYYFTKEGNMVHVRACGTKPPKTEPRDDPYIHRENGNGQATPETQKNGGSGNDNKKGDNNNNNSSSHGNGKTGDASHEKRSTEWNTAAKILFGAIVAASTLYAGYKLYKYITAKDMFERVYHASDFIHLNELTSEFICNNGSTEVYAYKQVVILDNVSLGKIKINARWVQWNTKVVIIRNSEFKLSELVAIKSVSHILIQHCTITNDMVNRYPSKDDTIRAYVSADTNTNQIRLGDIFATSFFINNINVKCAALYHKNQNHVNATIIPMDATTNLIYFINDTIAKYKFGYVRNTIVYSVTRDNIHCKSVLDANNDNNGLVWNCDPNKCKCAFHASLDKTVNKNLNNSCVLYMMRQNDYVTLADANEFQVNEFLKVMSRETNILTNLITPEYTAISCMSDSSARKYTNYGDSESIAKPTENMDAAIADYERYFGPCSLTMMRRYPYSNSLVNNRIINRVNTILNLSDDKNVIEHMKSRKLMYSSISDKNEYAVIVENAKRFIDEGFKFNSSVSLYFALMRLGISEVIQKLRKKYRLIVWQNDTLMAVANCGDHLYGRVSVNLDQSNDKMITAFRLLADDYDDYYLYSYKKGNSSPSDKVKTFALKIESLDDLPSKDKIEFQYLWLVLDNDFSKFGTVIDTFKPNNLVLTSSVDSGNTLNVDCLKSLNLNHLIIDEHVLITSKVDVNVKYLTICNPTFTSSRENLYSFFKVETTSNLPNVSICQHEFYTREIRPTTTAELSKRYGIKGFGESLKKYKNNCPTGIAFEEPSNQDELVGIRKRPSEIMGSSFDGLGKKFRQLQSALVFELTGVHDWRNEFKYCVAVAEYPYKGVSKYDGINIHICRVVANMQNVDPHFQESYSNDYFEVVTNTSTKYNLAKKRGTLTDIMTKPT